MDLFGEKPTPQTESGPSRNLSVVALDVVWLAFMGWVISCTSRWEDYSDYFGEGKFPGIGRLPTFWSFDSALEIPWCPWVCHLACWLRTEGSFKVAQRVQNLPTVWETQVNACVRKIPWRWEWQPTPVFLSGQSHGQRSLPGYMTEWLTFWGSRSSWSWCVCHLEPIWF